MVKFWVCYCYVYYYLIDGVSWWEDVDFVGWVWSIFVFIFVFGICLKFVRYVGLMKWCCCGGDVFFGGVVGSVSELCYKVVV